MTCEKCLCKKVCCVKSYVEKGSFSNMVEQTCTEFKDIDKFFESPCKVGDIIYDVIPSKLFKNRIIKTKVKDIHLTYVTDSFVGHNIILTEEEAKTKLKTMKKREDIL